jgi:hypothetical protein
MLPGLASNDAGGCGKARLGAVHGYIDVYKLRNEDTV